MRIGSSARTARMTRWAGAAVSFFALSAGRFAAAPAQGAAAMISRRMVAVFFTWNTP